MIYSYIGLIFFIYCIALCIPSTNAQVVPVTVKAAGSSFPSGLYTAWMNQYVTTTDFKNKYTGTFSYTSEDDSATQYFASFIAGNYTFLGPDIQLTTTEQNTLATATATTLYHLPSVVTAVSVVYNIPGFNATLKLDGDIIADIYNGKITKWNDTRITTLNPTLAYNGIISVVGRSDAASTTFEFTSYIARHIVNSTWASGVVASMTWPNYVSQVAGGGGLATYINTNVGTIGYAKRRTAMKNNCKMAALLNKDGAYVAPTTDASMLAFIDGLAQKGLLPKVTDNWYASFAGTPAPALARTDYYPATTLSMIVVTQVMPNNDNQRATLDFLKWCNTAAAQAYVPADGYVAIPASVLTQNTIALSTVTFATSKPSSANMLQSNTFIAIMISMITVLIAYIL